MFVVVFMIIIFMDSLQKVFLQFTVTLTDKKTTVFTSTFCMDGEFAQARYKCIYNAILIKKFDEVKINQLLNQTCQIYFARSSYLERINGTAKSCFKITRHFLQKSDITININFVVTNCCFTCFKNFIFNFLSDEFYYVSNRLNMLQK